MLLYFPCYFFYPSIKSLTVNSCLIVSETCSHVLRVTENFTEYSSHRIAYYLSNSAQKQTGQI